MGQPDEPWDGPESAYLRGYKEGVEHMAIAEEQQRIMTDIRKIYGHRGPMGTLTFDEIQKVVKNENLSQ